MGQLREEYIGSKMIRAFPEAQVRVAAACRTDTVLRRARVPVLTNGFRVAWARDKVEAISMGAERKGRNDKGVNVIPAAERDGSPTAEETGLIERQFRTRLGFPIVNFFHRAGEDGWPRGARDIGIANDGQPPVRCDRESLSRV